MKEPLILIPGVGSNQVLWEHQVHHLEDIVDARVKILYHAEGRTELVNHLLKEAPDRFALAGHSYGGWLAQVAAAEAPQRVSKLMLFNTFSRYNETHMARLCQWLVHIDNNLLIDTLNDNLKDIVHHNRLNDKEFVKSLQDMQHGFPQDGYRCQIQAIINDYETTKLLPQISSPTLVVHGRGDSAYPLEEHRYITNHINGAKLTIIEECGHMAPMEQPQAVTALMRLWLSG